jgi:hypothetical protein
MNVMGARELLPNMPDEVFSLYIEPLIQLYGWPYRSIDSPGTKRWTQAFDHQGIKTISQLSWKRHEVPFPLALFHPDAHQVIALLINQHIRGIPTATANVVNTKQKFFHARDYIARTGRMPKPVILMRDLFGGALRILDGNHRLAAMSSVPNANDLVIDCWIGTL